MQENVSDPLVGTLVDNRYLVQSRLARGGMSTVYLATDQRLERDVALKVLHPHLVERRQLPGQAGPRSQGRGQAVPPPCRRRPGPGLRRPTAYLVMEYIKGHTLRDVIKEKGALSPRLALALIDPVVEGLGAAHAAGLIHRDIKPENVLIADDGRIKVGDFGLARAVTTSTSTGALIGTVAYLSPELVLGKPADARSDIYSVGIMLYEMITGQQPFDGEVPIQVAYQHVNSSVGPPRPGAGAGRRSRRAGAVVHGQGPRASARWTATRCCRSYGTSAPTSPTRNWISSPRRRIAAVRPALPPGRARRPPARSRRLSGRLPTGTPGPDRGPVRRTSIPPKSSPAAAIPPRYSRLRRGDPASSVPWRPRPSRTRPSGTHEDDGPDTAGPAEQAGAAQAWTATRRRRSQRAAATPVRIAARRQPPPPRAPVDHLLVIAALLATGAGWFFGMGPGSPGTIPAVANKTVAEAQQLLRTAGFQSTTKDVFDDDIPAGLVVGPNLRRDRRSASSSRCRCSFPRVPSCFRCPN